MGRIAEIFGRFGFIVHEGPEVEDDLTNFQMLNIAPDHPARDLWDTLYVDVPGHLLRTHTSPLQIRVMEAHRPPIRALLPGRVFRYEAVDASHASEFFQVEGLMVDEGTTMGDLRGLLDEFARAMFGRDKRTRFRPGYYPFTEPSVAFDVECLVCGGSGCPACSRTGWMTILGAGMVHPVVLQYGGLDPERYQGFAFGMGVERIANLRHGVGRPAPVHRERPPIPGAVPMRVPLNWLRDYVDIELTPEQLAERLTVLGMEVKGIEAWGADWRSVVVGELLTVARHPRADRLSLTTVDVGGGQVLEIVCGATNIAPGQRVPVALPGAVLPGGRQIERAEKMGVVSNGMLCSGDELNLTSDAEGILILPRGTPIGTELASLYGDTVLDVDVKPNRGDALSLVGLAREVSIATGATVRFPEIELTEAGRPTAELVSIAIDEPALCGRFVARYLGGIHNGPSPDVVQVRLQAAGMRPISSVVDASNYVMLELGKPTHAFDAAAVRDRHLVVRRARSGERLTTLDHVERELTVEDLVVADATGALAIAGILGGASSEVSDGTTDVIIESAIFDPVAIRRTGQRYALRSEASLRFEKGQEFRLARIGADRVAGLIATWTGATVAPGRADSATGEPEPARLAFRPARIDRLLGTRFGATEQRRILARAGITTEESSSELPVTVAGEPKPLTVTSSPGEADLALIPTWRADIQIESDLAEEVARAVGYETIPAILPDTAMPAFLDSPLGVRDLVRETLAGAGLTEVITTALVAPERIETFRPAKPGGPRLAGDDPAEGRPIRAVNALSADHSVLRQGLLGSLIEVVATNLHHGRDDIAVFEVGKGYGYDEAGGAVREWWRLGFALTGQVRPPAWSRPAEAWQVDDAKGLLELVALRLGFAPPTWTALQDEPVFHPGLSATGLAADALAGRLGELHPALLAELDLRAERIVIGEFAVRGLAGGSVAAVTVHPIGRFPAAERDLAVVVGRERTSGEVERTIRAAGGELLRAIRLFDIYRGAPLAAGEHSLAWRLVFQADERTLTDAEIEAIMSSIGTALADELGGRIRS